MPRNQTTGRLPLFFVVSLMTFALTACDLMGMAHRPPTPLTKLQLVPTTVQAETLSCDKRPTPPDIGATQADVAVYVREVTSWGDECEAKLADVREILRPSQEVTE